MWSANSPFGTLVSFRAGLVEQTLGQLSLETNHQMEVSHSCSYVALVGLELEILLPQLHEC